MESRAKYIFDMETGDPDDFLTLALLCGHPEVDLVAVTVTPGTPHQVGMVRYGLNRFGLDIPVGAFSLGHLKARGTPEERYVTCVSPWHYKTFGEIPPSQDAEEGWRVLDRLFDRETTLVTGAPLKNVGRLVRETAGVKRGRLFVQGGFAGEGVVPPLKQLPKFKGMVTCPTYNLNGDPKSALAVIQHPEWADLRFISKNVCHGVVYDREMQERVRGVPNPHPGLQFILETMEKYLRHKPSGKKFHDPLAACCAIDPAIGEWARVELYREKGQWGSRLDDTKRTQILIGYDPDRFFEVLAGEGS